MTFAREANRSAHAARKTNSILCRAMSAERAVIIEGFIGGDVKAPTDRAVHGVARSLLRQSRRRYLGRRRHSTCSLQWRRALVVSSLGQTERDVPRHWSCHLHWQRQAVKTARASYYFAYDRGAEYCDEPVCLYVCVCPLCPRSYPWNQTSDFRHFFVHVAYGRGSVLLWRRSDVLRISGFMDDVIFAHKLRLLDRRRRRQAEAVRLTHWAWRVGIPVAGSGRSGYFLQPWPTRLQWACWIFVTSNLHIMSLHI